MRLSALLHFTCLLASAPLTAAFASDQSDILAVVKQTDTAFNKGDMKSFLALCAPNPIIIDDFAPHVWQGASACANWWNGYDADAKNENITDGIVTIGKPHRLEITGDRAYVVLYPKYTYKQKGQSITETGSAWTFAMQKIGGDWRIAGWAWAQH